MGLIECVQGSSNFLDFLSKNGNSFHFYLLSSYTDTVKIKGITEAGLPGFIDYTPALDMEVLYYGYPRSLPDLAQMPEGPPSPVLISSCVRSLSGIPVSFIDLGLKVSSRAPAIKIFSSYSASILSSAGVLSKDLYLEGELFASELLRSPCPDVFILGECVPGGTTTAYAVSKGLGYINVDGAFSSSSSSEGTYSLKRSVVDEAVSSFGEKISDVFDAIHHLGDNMQAFISGMVTKLSKSKRVILAGGSQMAAIYAILKKLDKSSCAFENVALLTTKWIFEDKHSDVGMFLKEIDSSLNVFYADFDFSSSVHDNLRLYDKGYVKEGVGAGALLSYAYLRGFTKDDIVNSVDKLYSSFLSS